MVRWLLDASTNLHMKVGPFVRPLTRPLLVYINYPKSPKNKQVEKHDAHVLIHYGRICLLAQTCYDGHG